jgi:hypothetical protein
MGAPTGVPDLTKGMMLKLKQETDLKHFSPEWLAGLDRKRWLGYDPEPLPDWYLDQRRRNDG